MALARSCDNSTIAAALSNRTVALLDATTLITSSSGLSGHTGTISDLSFDRTNPHLVLSASEDRTARGWDLRAGAQVHYPTIELQHSLEPFNLQLPLTCRTQTTVFPGAAVRPHRRSPEPLPGVGRHHAGHRRRNRGALLGLAEGRRQGRVLCGPTHGRFDTSLLQPDERGGTRDGVRRRTLLRLRHPTRGWRGLVAVRHKRRLRGEALLAGRAPPPQARAGMLFRAPL